MSLSTHIVVDLGFGDAGKGTMVDAIARRCSSAPLVVRHNGGAQAGHNVHTADGRHHTFSQFGAASFVPGARTLLSKHFVLHPPGLMGEHEHLASVGAPALDRLVIDELALVITPYHQAVNRLREAVRRASPHGTCGLGVGETVADSLEEGEHVVRAKDLREVGAIRWKLICARNRKLEQAEPFLGQIDPANRDLQLLRDPTSIDRTADIYEAIGKRLRIVSSAEAEREVREAEHVIFEGAQGVLLDEWHGFHPHTTWSTTTTENADTMIDESGRGGQVTRMGVVRAYATRHGQGPFPTEDTKLTEQLREAHNTDDGPQGRFRCGWFDCALTWYAMGCCARLDALAVTCLDRLASVPSWKISTGYDPGLCLASKRGDLEHQAELTRVLSTHANPSLVSVPSDHVGYISYLEELLDLPITVTSHSPTAGGKRWR